MMLLHLPSGLLPGCKSVTCWVQAGRTRYHGQILPFVLVSCERVVIGRGGWLAFGKRAVNCLRRTLRYRLRPLDCSWRVDFGGMNYLFNVATFGFDGNANCCPRWVRKRLRTECGVLSFHVHGSGLPPSVPQPLWPTAGICGFIFVGALHPSPGCTRCIVLFGIGSRKLRRGGCKRLHTSGQSVVRYCRGPVTAVRSFDPRASFSFFFFKQVFMFDLWTFGPLCFFSSGFMLLLILSVILESTENEQEGETRPPLTCVSILTLASIHSSTQSGKTKQSSAQPLGLKPSTPWSPGKFGAVHQTPPLPRKWKHVIIASLEKIRIDSPSLRKIGTGGKQQAFPVTQT